LLPDTGFDRLMSSQLSCGFLKQNEPTEVIEISFETGSVP